MHRLVIALTTLLTLVGVVVVAGYLFVFAASPDRTARAAPADSVAYAMMYLQPSTGQRMNLAELLGRMPGFADQAALDQKIHEIAQRLLADAGFDYEADLRPWLGDQLAIAAGGSGLATGQPAVVALISVTDPGQAEAALERMAAADETAYRAEAHRGVAVMVSPDSAYALLDDLLVVSDAAAAVRAALDADADRAPSLADEPAFSTAMGRLPADHLGVAYLDLAGLGQAADAGEQLAGYDSLAVALVVERDGIRVAGSAPFDADAASVAAREGFALASEPSSLADWMPTETQAEGVVFGLAQTFEAFEEQLGTTPGLEDAAEALVQLRVIAAFLLGINIDTDVLPLLDREAALAIAGLDTDQPRGQLLLRPGDPEDATGALERLRDALSGRGAAVDERDESGVTITTIELQDVPAVSYAMRDGVVILGLDPADVVAALQANADGTSLGTSERYRDAWELAGDRGGNELYLDVASLVDRMGELIDLPADGRDILHEIGALAVTVPAREDAIEFHLVITVR